MAYAEGVLNRPNHPHYHPKVDDLDHSGVSESRGPADVFRTGNLEISPGEVAASVATLGVDVLAPWGEAGPPPVGQWRPDVLGIPFESRTIPLSPDEEGEKVATLVRFPSGETASPPSPHLRKHRGHQRSSINLPRRFIALYIHGRNDYFFHEEVARQFTDMGAAFYALDLHKYGRSLRPWQTIGYTTDFSTYDQDFSGALEIIREEHPDLPLVIVAHSTGGLIATLWASRHPDELAGLILNSAWLGLHVPQALRPALQQVAARVSAIRPRTPLLGTSRTGVYSRSLTEGWKTSGFKIPEYFEHYPDDPALTGWKCAPEWKWPYSYPAPAAWLVAILDGHSRIEKGVHLECPVLAMSSTSSGVPELWARKVFDSDVILDATLITRRATFLSNEVTIIRAAGKHDLFLSDPPVRTYLYATIRRWLEFAVFSAQGD